MQYRKLGRTDMEVSVVCQGCWSIVSEDSTWGGNAIEDSIAAIRASFESGVNFFDTAEGYGGGESEQILRDALDGKRKEVILASKVSKGNLAPEKLKAHCEQSLKNLGTDYLDLYQIHWPDPEIPVADSLEAMEELKQEGKIRAIGVSNFGVSFMKDLVQAGRVESNQLPYNLLWRCIEHEILPMCREQEMSVLCYSPICQGLLTGKFDTPDQVPEGRARSRLFSNDRPQSRHGEPGCETEMFDAIRRICEIAKSVNLPPGRMSLAWLLHQPGVGSVIAGARNPQQAKDNAQAGEVNLSDEIVEALRDATNPVKNALDTNCDMWESPSRMEK